MQKTRLLPLGLGALLAACGSDGATTEPGTLTITLSGTPPAATNTGTLAIAGQVTRTPADGDQVIVVSVSGGPTTTSDTAGPGGDFSLAVVLNPNMQNSLSIGATDESGSTATPVTVSIRHDNQPPQIASMSPANESDGVTPAAVAVSFNEPIEPGTAQMSVSVQGGAVAGQPVALSADSLTLTFTPTQVLAVNAIHVVSVSARDALGNQLTGGLQCFVTGGAGISSFPDPANDIFAFGAPSQSLVPPDVRGIRFVRDGTRWNILLEFSAPRSPDGAAANNVLSAIDFDLDQDGGTGTITAKDTLYSGILPASGARAEYALFIQSMARPADSSAVGPYVAPLTISPTFLFIPGFCGKLVGASVPASALGNDDGAFHAVSLHLAINTNGDGSTLEDPVPQTGFHAVTLAAGAGAAVSTGVVPARRPPITLPVLKRPMR